MAIIDAFIFSDELDMLELRLNTLDTVVDRFVLVEADQTFQGNPKPLHYHEHRHEPRFTPFAHRITSVIVRNLPDRGPWAREAAQRNAIMDGLLRSDQHAWPDDLILISDVDELPNPAAIAALASAPTLYAQQTVAFRQHLYSFSVNWRHVRPWYGTRALRFWSLVEPQALRSTLAPRPQEHVIADGGWSFSWMGGVQAIQAKARAFSHAEVNRPDYLDPDHLAACIAEGRSFVPGDGNEYVWQDIDDSYPPYLLEHFDDTYQHWLHDRALVTGWPH